MPKFYTLDDLYDFCKEHNLEKFSAAESGAPLSVHLLETFEVGATTDGLLPVKLQSCHTGINRNKSQIAEDVMEKCAPTFKGRPILGAIYETDTGEYEFRAHDILYDEDGNEEEYIEQPIGAISDSKEPYLEYDAKKDKTYLIVEGNIFEEYTKAAEIMQRREVCPCSVEILINDMSWNVEDDVLVINDFSFRGVTILGYKQDGVTPIQEGMEGSNVTVAYSEQEGGEMKMDNIFEQLLEKYGVKAEDLNFEYDGLSDDELTEKFKEQFEAPVDEGEAPIEDEVFSRTFSIEISHEDIRSALYNLLSPIEQENSDCFYIRNVYDDYFVAESWCTNKLYKWGYAVEDSVVSLNGEPQEVFEIIVTEAEKAALDLMRSEYDALKQFKQDYDAAQVEAQKNEIFDEYSFLEGNKDFEALKVDAKNYSVDEIKTQVKIIHSDCICAGQTFEYHSGPEAKTHHKVGISNANMETPERKPYGNLFDD